jgi:6-phospho-beta-glucosidase
VHGGPVRQALRAADRLDGDVRSVDDPADPLTGLDQPAGCEIGKRAAKGVPRDIEAFTELAFRRKTFTSRQAARGDVSLEPPHDPDVREIRSTGVDSPPSPRARLTGLVHSWFTRGVKLALLGGGGFRTPAIYRALAEGGRRIHYDELVLYDVDSARLDRIAAVLKGVDERLGRSVPFTTTTELDDAVDGADVVYCAVRVGGLNGRLLDETAALAEGVIGQETTGAGGITFALRTVPVVTEIAEVVARRAPGAIFINFTNPVGLVTEAIRRVLGDRVIGICDAPEALCRRVAAALDREPADLWFDYFGINHLGWLRAVLDHGRDLLPGLLADERRILGFEEGRLFGVDWLRSIGMIPNEYLYYYDFANDALTGMQAGRVRAEFLSRQQDAFYGGSGSHAEALASWEETLAEREGSYMEEAWTGRDDELRGVAAARDTGGYGRLSLDLVDALNGDRPEVMILNVANRSSLPFLDDSAVVEVPCVVSRGGVVPVAMGRVPMAAAARILAVRAAERAAIEASFSHSRQAAVHALALHPLVPSVEVASRILDRHLKEQPGLAETLR